jgi:hypothetical protein
MTSREWVAAALAHEEADHVPLDLGGTPATQMHVDSHAGFVPRSWLRDEVARAEEEAVI